MDVPVDPPGRDLALALEVNALAGRVDTVARELRRAIHVSRHAREEAWRLRQELKAALAWHVDRR
jgi:hypothetical protein